MVGPAACYVTADAWESGDASEALLQGAPVLDAQRPGPMAHLQ
ncbi:hypothetical protein [Xanthomonas citri]|nr:hypothetical protein [Xanthomonas citri]